MKQTRRILGTLLAVVLIAGISLPSIAEGSLSKDDINKIVETATDPAKVESPVLNVAKTARISVVGIRNYQVQRGTYFGYGNGYYSPAEKEMLAGTGSGVVISPYGHILTNYHVVEGASRVSIHYDGKEVAATVVGSDSALDIAVLHAPGIDLPAAPLGDSDKLQVGEYAVVIGNPLGEDFERTVTVGFVSAINREVEKSGTDRYGRRFRSENNMIQVDAAINSGNSGGGMFNTLGQLQGIPSLKYVNSGSSSIFGFGMGQQQASVDNIGMCIPINVAKPLIKSVLESYNEKDVQAAAATEKAEKGKEVRPRMGVTVSPISPYAGILAEGVLPKGAHVVTVEEKSPAEKAGLKMGDIIVEVNGEVIRNTDDLSAIIRAHKAGDTLKLHVYRFSIDKADKGEYIDVNVQLQIIDDMDI